MSEKPIEIDEDGHPILPDDWGGGFRDYYDEAQVEIARLTAEVADASAELTATKEALRVAVEGLEHYKAKNTWAERADADFIKWGIHRRYWGRRK